MSRRTNVGIALVVLAWLVGLWPLVVGGETLAAEQHIAATLGWHSQVAAAVQSANLPQWDGASGLGVQLAGDTTRAALYPPVWLAGMAASVVSLPVAVDLLLALHLLLLGVGVMLWSYRLGAQPLAAAAVGGAALLSAPFLGLMADAAALYQAAWLPMVGASATQLARAQRPSHSWLPLAASLGAVFLVGAPSFAVAALALAVGAALASSPSGIGALLANLRAVSPAIVLATGAALGLGAMTLLPALGLDRGAQPAQVLEPLASSDFVALAFALTAIVLPRAKPEARATAIVMLALYGASIAFGDGSAVLRLAAMVCGFAIAGLGLTRPVACLVGERRWVERKQRLRAVLGAVALAVVVLAPLVHARRTLETLPREAIEQPPAILPAGAVDRRAPRPRLSWPDVGERGYNDAPPDTAVRFGYAHLPSRESFRDPSLLHLWRRASGAGERLLDLFGVEWVVVPASVATPAGLAVVGQAERGDRVLADNVHRRPRAFVAPVWSWHQDAKALEEAVFPTAPDQVRAAALARTRLLGQGEAAPPHAAGEALPPSPCDVTAIRAERLDVRCASETGGYAVLLERFADGWTATVDGTATPIVRADLLLRAVRVPAGEHLVVFSFRAPGLAIGVAISAVTLIVLAAFAAHLARRRRRRPVRAPA